MLAALALIKLAPALAAAAPTAAASAASPPPASSPPFAALAALAPLSTLAHGLGHVFLP